MSFENTVLAEVTRTEPTVRAYFDSGTLFYSASEPQSRRIFSNLFRQHAGQVQISLAGHEYAVDFVAKKQHQKSEDFSPYATVNS
jgi:hypothetical protein